MGRKGKDVEKEDRKEKSPKNLVAVKRRKK